MTDAADIRKQAQELREAEKFQDALPLYENLWQNHPALCDEWVGWAYAYCLQRTQQYEKGLEIAREAYLRNSEFSRIRTVYATCIYHTAITKSADQIKLDEATFMKAANAIAKLVKQEKYSPLENTVFKVVQYLDDKNPYPAEDILKWLDLLNPIELSAEPFKATSNDGLLVEHKSNREKWYHQRCKAFFKAERYQECIDCGTQSFQAIPRFYEGTDASLHYWIAQAKRAKGDLKGALLNLKNAIDLKDNWNYHREASEILLELNYPHKAAKEAAAALLSAGETASKWRLVLSLTQYLISRNEADEVVRAHIRLANIGCKVKGGKITNELWDLLGKYQVQIDDMTSEPDISDKLKPVWKKLMTE